MSKPIMAKRVLVQLAILTALGSSVMGQQMMSSFECSNTDLLIGQPGSFLGRHPGLTTQLQCARACSATCSCDVMQYCPEDETCDLFGTCPGCVSAMNVTETCFNGETPMTARMHIDELVGAEFARTLITGSTVYQCTCTNHLGALTCSRDRYLVTGPCGVTDAQLSESSHWCQGYPDDPDCLVTPDGHSARFGRRNETLLPFDTWVPNGNNLGEYIQVNFLKVKTATGVVIYGRTGCCNMYVKAFKVLHSTDCMTFTPLYDDLGNEKVFDGCTYADEEVTRCFDVPISAMCIRISPTAWNSHISMRFDILGI